MTYFTASFSTITLRFFLMMGIIIGSFLSGFPFLALLALPVFLAALTGLSFNGKSNGKAQNISVANKNSNKMNTAA